MIALEGLDHVAIAVRDTELSAHWYMDVLGFERAHDDVWNRKPIFLMKGQTGIALFRAHNDAALIGSKSDHIGMTHFAFRASRTEFLRAQEELKSRGIGFEFSDHKISHSIYFSDPDGIRLEITTYEVK